MARTASHTAVAALVIAGLLALWHARDLVFVLTAGLLFGVGLAAPVDALERRRLPRWAGTLLVLGALGGLTWLASTWIGPRIAEQTRQIREQLPVAAERIGSRAPFEGLAEAGELEKTARDRLLEESGTVVRRALRLLSSIVCVVAAALLVVAVAIWYAANPDTYRRALVRLAPPHRRETMPKK